VQISREQILQQNQKDRAYFASFSVHVQDALDAQATIALDTWANVCIVYHSQLVSVTTETEQFAITAGAVAE
jgi:hypothetical protein